MHYELKKLFSSKLLFVCLALLAVIYGFLVRIAFENRISYSKEYTAFIENLERDAGSIENKIEYVENRINSINDLIGKGEKINLLPGEFGNTLLEDIMIFTRARDFMRRMFVEFPAARKRLVMDALYVLEDQNKQSEPDKKTIALYDLIVKKYNTKIDAKLFDNGSIDKPVSIFEFSVWDFSFALFAIMLTVRMFTMDKAAGASIVIDATSTRRKRLFMSQLFAVFIICALVATVAMVTEMICGAVFFGVNDLSIPIQMTESFEFCPFALTVGGYYLIRLACMLLFSFTLICITAFLSIMFNRSLFVMPLSIAFWSLPLIAYIVYRNDVLFGRVNILDDRFKVFEALRTILPHGLIDLKMYLTSFDHAWIISGYYPRIIVCAGISGFLSCIFMLLGMKQFEKRKNKLL